MESEASSQGARQRGCFLFPASAMKSRRAGWRRGEGKGSGFHTMHDARCTGSTGLRLNDRWDRGRGHGCRGWGKSNANAMVGINLGYVRGEGHKAQVPPAPHPPHSSPDRESGWPAGGGLDCLCECLQALTFREPKSPEPTASWTGKEGFRTVVLPLAQRRTPVRSEANTQWDCAVHRASPSLPACLGDGSPADPP